MAAAITLSATTAEQQALELSSKLAAVIAEDRAANPNTDIKGMSVSQSVNLNTQRATFTIVIPLVKTHSADGGIEFDAETVLA